MRKKPLNVLSNQKKVFMLKIVLLILFFLAESVHAKTFTGRVMAVLDGDTIKVLRSDNGLVKIRLADIDAPEKHQPFGAKSKQTLSMMIFNQDVVVEYTKIGKYGRIIGTVFLYGVDINIQMVKLGMAWRYTAYCRNPKYIQAERKAKRVNAGLWSDDNPVAPWIYRRELRNKKH